MKTLISLLLFFFSLSAIAKEQIYLSKSEKYISLGRNLSGALEELALNEFGTKTKGKTVIGDGDGYWVVGSPLRAQFLTELGIAETDNLYLKIFDKEKTEVHAISKLNFVIELNFAGGTHVASFGFEYREDGAAIAMIGKENPFRDVAMKTLFSSKGIYRLDSKLSLELKKDGKEFDIKNGKDESGFLVGEFTIVLHAGKKREDIYKVDLEAASYVTGIDVFAGEIFKDGTTTILIKDGDCGDFVKIDKNKVEKWKSLCGSWGC
ncbi:hypothetical protein DOM22_12625 [Bdellovibrio sp. ZAP7]|uniref:hypothetical protein n=1 Tax=Bdellovibrio sp. ZAP7 TaxID=2231053 RepID=UPI0011592338|nr:hypothetical protein [Bdellovibrio sp. ZAP7]QDK45935.1 hypothetical protein DOM22_12625 [Bdellovibrio sp. ZAP7]